MKYRKKPIIVDAERFDANNPSHRVQVRITEVLGHAKKDFFVTTLEGDMQVKAGDWIIKGIEGEIYPCKNSIFEKIYEKVEE